MFRVPSSSPTPNDENLHSERTLQGPSDRLRNRDSATLSTFTADSPAHTHRSPIPETPNVDLREVKKMPWALNNKSPAANPHMSSSPLGEVSASNLNSAAAKGKERTSLRLLKSRLGGEFGLNEGGTPSPSSRVLATPGRTPRQSLDSPRNVYQQSELAGSRDTLPQPKSQILRETSARSLRISTPEPDIWEMEGSVGSIRSSRQSLNLVRRVHSGSSSVSNSEVKERGLSAAKNFLNKLQGKPKEKHQQTPSPRIEIDDLSRISIDSSVSRPRPSFDSARPRSSFDIVSKWSLRRQKKRTGLSQATFIPPVASDTVVSSVASDAGTSPLGDESDDEFEFIEPQNVKESPSDILARARMRKASTASVSEKAPAATSNPWKNWDSSKMEHEGQQAVCSPVEQARQGRKEDLKTVEHTTLVDSLPKEDFTTPLKPGAVPDLKALPDVSMGTPFSILSSKDTSTQGELGANMGVKEIITKFESPVASPAVVSKTTTPSPVAGRLTMSPITEICYLAPLGVADKAKLSITPVMEVCSYAPSPPINKPKLSIAPVTEVCSYAPLASKNKLTLTPIITIHSQAPTSSPISKPGILASGVLHLALVFTAILTPVLVFAIRETFSGSPEFGILVLFEIGRGLGIGLAVCAFLHLFADWVPILLPVLGYCAGQLWGVIVMTVWGVRCAVRCVGARVQDMKDGFWEAHGRVLRWAFGRGGRGVS